MRAVFADASYWIALLHPGDSLHAQARLLSSSLGPVKLVTSEMVLTECLNDFARRGVLLRKAVVELIKQLREDPDVQVVPQSSDQFRKAIALYAAREDKGWSHTDCCSFQIMEEKTLADALTHDRHFEQAGFRALLRTENGF